MDNLNLSVVITQSGEHIHSYDIGSSVLSIDGMVKEVLSRNVNDDIDMSLPLEFIAYINTDSEEIDVVYAEGKIRLNP